MQFIVGQLKLNELKKKKRKILLFLTIYKYWLILFITYFRPVCLVNLTISARASSELDWVFLTNEIGFSSPCFSKSSDTLKVRKGYFKFFFNVFIYFWDRERAWAEEGQRERETLNLKQAPGFKLSAQSPKWGSNSQTVRSYLSWSQTLNQLRHPGAPRKGYFKVLLPNQKNLRILYM